MQEVEDLRMKNSESERKHKEIIDKNSLLLEENRELL